MPIDIHTIGQQHCVTYKCSCKLIGTINQNIAVILRARSVFQSLLVQHETRNVVGFALLPTRHRATERIIFPLWLFYAVCLALFDGVDGMETAPIFEFHVYHPTGILIYKGKGPFVTIIEQLSFWQNLPIPVCLTCLRWMSFDSGIFLVANIIFTWPERLLQAL